MSAIALPSEETTSSLDAQKSPPDHDPFANRNSTFANRSTGPRSPEGKSRSSQNARKHNLSATTPPPSLLSNPTYQISRQEYFEKFNPQTPAQKTLVDQLTFISWKLDQIPHLEHQLLSTPIGQTEPTPVDQATAIDPATYLFAQLTDDNALPPPKDPTNTITATHLLQNQATPLTRLWDYHRRLLAHFQSLLRQINQLKRQQQTAQQTRQREEDRQREADHDTLSQCIEEMHQRNKAREEAERRQRQQNLQTPKTAPAQNELPHYPASIEQHCAENKPAQNELPQSEDRRNPTG